MQYACLPWHSLQFPFLYSACQAQEAASSDGPMSHVSSVGLKANTKWVYYVYKWVSEDTDTSKFHAFCLNQNLLCIQKKGNDILRNINDWRIKWLLYSFLPSWLPCVSQLLTLKMMTYKEKESWATHTSFSFQSSILISKLKEEFRLTVHVLKKKWNKNSWVNFV